MTFFPEWEFPGDLVEDIDKRLPLISFGLVGLLLVDEFVKEGYWFKWGDLTDIGSHETIIVTLASIGFMSLLINPPQLGVPQLLNRIFGD